MRGTKVRICPRNIRAQLNSTNTTDDAVLFSAHFDSVSTAPGATDDGMSVVALVQMLEFLSKNRPRRTAVFNLNNGEEDSLNGAQVYAALILLFPSFFFVHSSFDRFLRHPWSNLTSTFLNFEGAGSGGYVRFHATCVLSSPHELLFAVAPSSSDRRRMISSKPSAPHRTSTPTPSLKTPGIEASSAQTPTTPCTPPLGPGTFPRTLQEMIR